MDLPVTEAFSAMQSVVYQSNSDRIQGAIHRGTLPYFIGDNFNVGENGELVRKTLEAKPKTEVTKAAAPTKLSLLQRAEQRHKARTEEEINAIKLKIWNRELERNAPHLTETERKALSEHWLELEKELGIKKGKMMTIEEADRQSANPNVDKGKEFRTNCQTCSPAYVLRQWGFDVTSKGNTEGSLSEYLSYSPFDAWENIDGTNVSPTLAREWLSKYGYKQMTEKRWNKYFNETCKEEGTYLLTIGWKGGRGGHATVLQKTKEGLFNIEPQEYDEKNRSKKDD